MADRSVVYRLSADITQFRAQMAQASAAVKKTATDMTALDKNGATMRRGLDSLGGAAGKVGLVAAAGLGAAVYAAANFDKAMSSVQAATGESAANMDKLREAAIKAGAETAFSASEAAAGIENLAKAGVSTSDILAGGLNGALDLAAAGSVDVAFAAETAATAMTQFGLSGEQVPHIADLLAAAAGKAQGEVADFGAALKQSGLVAAQMGFSIEETTGTLAAFASAGLLGSDAGTSLKTMLLRLANPSKEAAAAMERFGISAYDAQGNMVPMTDLAGQLAGAFKDQDQATRDAALSTIFGSDAIRAANVLYNQGAQGIGEWTSKVNDSGFAADTAATKLDNLAGDFEELKGSLETALIGAGDGAQGPLRSLVQTLTDVTNAYNDLPQAVKTATTSMLGVTAILGGGLWFTAKTISGIASMKQNLQDLGVSADGAKGAMAGVAKAASAAALGVAAFQAYDAWDDAALSARQMELSLKGLADGKVTNDLAHLGLMVDDLGSALSDAAYGDFNLFGLGRADEIEQLDAAIADLASTSLPQAKAAFETIRAEADKAGVPFQDLIELFPEYRAQLALMGEPTSIWSDALQRMLPTLSGVGSAASEGASGVDEFGNAAAGAASKTDTFKAALAGLNGLLDKRDALRNYQAALDDFRGSFDKAAGFNIDLDPGRQNQAKLDAIAASAGTVASHLKGLARTEFVDSVIGQLRAMAKNMNLPRSQVNALIRELQKLDSSDASPRTTTPGVVEGTGAVNRLTAYLRMLDRTNANPSVTVGGVSQSIADLNALQARINSLQGKTIFNTVRTIGGPQAAPMATGGPVIGPGSATSDSIPAYLSNGEHVWTAREVANAGGHAAVEAMRQQFRFAEGGAVRAAPAQSVSVSTGPLTATTRLHPADIAAIVNGVERGALAGTAKGADVAKRAIHAGGRR